MMSKPLPKWLVPATITIIVYLSICLAGYLLPREEIHKFIIEAGYWGPVLFILLSLVTFIFAPISGSPVTFAGFYAFGENVVLYAGTAAVLASITNFWISRLWGRALIKKLIGQANISKIDELSQDYGLKTLFVSRIFLSGIHDFISYATGLTKINFWPYFIVSTLGMIPGVTLWYYIASKIQSPVTFTLLSNGVIVIFAAALYFGRQIFKKSDKQ